MSQNAFDFAKSNEMDFQRITLKTLETLFKEYNRFKKLCRCPNKVG